MISFKCSLFKRSNIKTLALLIVLGNVLGVVARKININSEKEAIASTTVATTSSDRLAPYNNPIYINTNDHAGKRSFPLNVQQTTAGIKKSDQNYSSKTTTELPYYNNANSNLASTFQATALPQHAYNKSDYYYNNKNRYSHLYKAYQNRQPYRLDLPMSAPVSQISGLNANFPEESTLAQNQYDYASKFYPDGLQYSYAQAHQQLRKHEEENSSSFEIEDKVFSKTVLATKALKIGKIVFTFFMVLVVLVLAGLGKLGLTVSPVVLPLALLPIGVIALLLFIPLFVLFLPLAATGAIGERRKRRRRRNADHLTTVEKPISIMEEFINALQEQTPKILDKIEVSASAW